MNLKFSASLHVHSLHINQYNGLIAGLTYLLNDTTTYGLGCCGTIKQWRMNIQNPGTIKLQVWKPDTTANRYVFKGENEYTYTSGKTNKVDVLVVSSKIKPILTLILGEAHGLIESLISIE